MRLYLEAYESRGVTMDSKQTRFGRLLKSARENAGHTRVTLGQRTGIPAPTIEAWEMGEMSARGPSAVGVLKLRRALGIDPAELEAALLDLPDGAASDATPTQLAVRAARTQLGVTVADLADMLGIEPATVTGYEHGVEDAPPAVMAAIVGLMTAELAAGQRRNHDS